MKVLIFKRFWTVDDVRKYRDYIFVYGDNDLHCGKGGQAIIRDESNTCGIPTKKAPNDNEESFYTDKELKQNKEKIDQSLQKLRSLISSKKYNGLVFSKDGLGTGLAKLDTVAPKTFLYMIDQIEQLKMSLVRNN